MLKWLFAVFGRLRHFILAGGLILLFVLHQTMYGIILLLIGLFGIFWWMYLGVSYGRAGPMLFEFGVFSGVAYLLIRLASSG